MYTTFNYTILSSFIGLNGPTILSDEQSGRERLHIEVPIDPDYTADDLCIRMNANKAVISGRKQVVDETNGSTSTLVQEFSRTYPIPETVDTFSVSAQLRGDRLLVEAPLLHFTSS